MICNVGVCLMLTEKFFPFSLKCEQNKQDKIVVGGSNGLDSSNMEISSSICGHSEKTGELAKKKCNTKITNRCCYCC